MTNIDKLIRVLFIAALVLTGAFLVSGIFVAVTAASNPNEIKKQVVFSMPEQKETFKPIEKSLLPGESINFDLSIESKLLENVKYDVTFSNHTVSDIDEYFYVSVINDKKECLISNTLDEIFNNNIFINGILNSNETVHFHFTFTLSQFFSSSGNFDFDLNANALGRIFN